MVRSRHVGGRRSDSDYGRLPLAPESGASAGVSWLDPSDHDRFADRRRRDRRSGCRQ